MRVKNKKHIMRTKQIYIGLIILMLGVFAVGAARAQPQQPSIQQGLLSKLIGIKYTSELYLSSALKQGSNKDSALANYNTLRWKLDGFIYQLYIEAAPFNYNFFQIDKFGCDIFSFRLPKEVLQENWLHLPPLIYYGAIQ